MTTTKRLCLWSGPRNISTTLMYSFAQRADTTVVDEPLYAYYLTTLSDPEKHPGYKDVLASQSNSSSAVIQSMMSDFGTNAVFFKNMAHHAVNIDLSFASECYNILLTRNPVDMLPSFHKVIPNPSIDDVGYKAHAELLEKLNAMDAKVCVLDSTKLLMDPEGILRQLCEFCDIDFDESMLSWPEGPIKEDGCWAKYWYDNVHKSTGFLPYKPKSQRFPEELLPLLKDCEKYYSVLEKHALS